MKQRLIGPRLMRFTTGSFKRGQRVMNPTLTTLIRNWSSTPFTPR